MSNSFVSLYMNDQVIALLDQMQATALYGDSREDVCATLVYRGIENAVAKGICHFPSPEVEASVDPEKPLYRCEHCHDGMKTVDDLTPAHKCPKCGEDPDIPF